MTAPKLFFGLLFVILGALSGSLVFAQENEATEQLTTPLAATFAPNSGHWQGTANSGRKVEFEVSEDGTIVTEFHVYIPASCGTVAVSTGSNQLAITNNMFSHRDPLIKVSGQFSDTIAAYGVYTVTGSGSFCIFPSQSGTWQAYAPPPPQAYLPIIMQQPMTPTVTPTSTLFMIDGLWRGNSTRNNQIAFEIQDHGFISFTTSYQIGGCGGTSSTFGGTVPIVGNTFVYVQPGANGASILTTGTFNSDATASGEIRVSGSPCGGSQGTWTATKQSVLSSLARTAEHSTADASIVQGAPGFNDGFSGTTRAGSEHCLNAQNTRSLMKFDLVGASAPIAQAQLRLYFDDSCDLANRTYPVTTYPVSEAREENSVTWNTQPGIGEAYGSDSFQSRSDD